MNVNTTHNNYLSCNVVPITDATKVVNMYWNDAILLPTLSDEIRDNNETMLDYFEHFLEKKPQGNITEYFVQQGCNEVVFDGNYDFTLTDPVTGQISTAHARFTYVYEKRGSEWKIITHHSSLQPAAAQDEDNGMHVLRGTFTSGTRSLQALGAMTMGAFVISFLLL